MSGNIQDTDVNRLNKQIKDLQAEIVSLEKSGEVVLDWEDTLARKYKFLVRTSKTLFKYILTNYNKEGFNEQFFNHTLKLMLNKIETIQASQTSQEDASASVGLHLAQKFIPQMKK